MDMLLLFLRYKKTKCIDQYNSEVNDNMYAVFTHNKSVFYLSELTQPVRQLGSLEHVSGFANNCTLYYLYKHTLLRIFK